MRYGTVCVSQGNEEKKNAGKNSQIKTGSITYIANTISMYAKLAAEPPVDRMSSTLKPIAKDMPVSFLKSNPAA